MRLRDLSLAVAALAFTACGDDPKPAPAPAPKTGATPAAPTSGIPVSTAPKAEEHSHEGKHGGQVRELGEHEGHLEIVHDGVAGTLAAYVYDAEMKPVAIDAPVINLTKGGVQVRMTSLEGGTGKADAWKATSDLLKVDPLDGRLRLKIGDRTYQPELEDGHSHK